MFNPKWIEGKTIVRVEMHPFPAYRRRSQRRPNLKAHNPIVWFTDGTSIAFSTEETEVGEYGTEIVYRKKAGK